MSASEYEHVRGTWKLDSEKGYFQQLGLSGSPANKEGYQIEYGSNEKLGKYTEIISWKGGLVNAFFKLDEPIVQTKLNLDDDTVTRVYTLMGKTLKEVKTTEKAGGGERGRTLLTTASVFGTNKMTRTIVVGETGVVAGTGYFSRAT